MNPGGGWRKLLRLFHTVRHLRPVQVYGRLWFRLYRPVPDTSRAPFIRIRNGAWALPAGRRRCMAGPSTFHLLHQTRSVESPADWDDPAVSRLWRYHLHYFDDLNAEDGASRTKWQEDLILRWISENPAGRGTGWEPYPVSLRIVNWIKRQLAGNALPEAAVQSLAVQARWLEKRLEWHLLGNHLFANAKALVFAGVFFAGSEAERWLKKGRAIVARELAEQVLPDGGHFERSPMYHALILEDLLDLVNLCRAFGLETPDEWEKTCRKMLDWLNIMTHPDGGIALFNDAAFGMAPNLSQLENYAGRLGIKYPESGSRGLFRLPATGYVRCENEAAVLFVDAAPVGPDYLPGHAHADTLNFELTLFNQRLIVDSGSSTYEKSPERERQRGTAAHNTVMINGCDSTEVWGGFRVARRARPFGFRMEENPGSLFVACAHDGYRRLPGSPVHRREYTLEKAGLKVCDHIEGDFVNAAARYHFHPAVRFALENGKLGKGRLPGGEKFIAHVVRGEARLLSASWHPEFGRSLPTKCLEVSFAGPDAEIRFSWN